MRAKSRSAALQPQPRFCWRERTEKLNWRLLRALHLPDVVRRGDPSVLEPYVLHLTFARLPASAVSAHDVVDGDDFGGNSSELRGHALERNAWFIVRVFQLATEYLLFMRSRDGTLLETLQRELELCNNESEAFAARATKWKARAKSGDKQVQKLHQVLQSIAKLLQIQGATPSAIETIETLLASLVPARKRRHTAVTDANNNNRDDTGDDGESDREAARRRVQEARQCYDCGKMFATAEFLARHRARRHMSDAMADARAGRVQPMPMPMPAVSPPAISPLAPNNSNSYEPQYALQHMLQRVEQSLLEHHESLRTVAQREVHKLEHLYEQLHGERQLADELRAARETLEQQVHDAETRLDALTAQTLAAQRELADTNEQLAGVVLRRKLQRSAASDDGNSDTTSLATAPADVTLALEMARLQQTLAAVNAALAHARSELSALQTTHTTALQDKRALAAELHDTQSRVEQLERVATAARASGRETCDRDSQVETLAVMHAAAQTESSELALLSNVMVADAAVQTTPYEPESELQRDEVADNVDMALQAEPVTSEPADDTPALPPVDIVVAADAEAAVVDATALPTALPQDAEDADAAVVSDYIFNIVATNVTDAVARRAQRAAATTTAEVADDPSLPMSSSTRVVGHFAPLAGRPYVRSRFAHSEQAVHDRVAAQLQQLEGHAQRFGVPPQCRVLSTAHLAVVQHALHGHLEVLPTRVLERMVAHERDANTVIEREWVPRERTRQLALERLRVESHARSARNQDLVRQAMAAFGVSVGAGVATDVRNESESTPLMLHAALSSEQPVVVAVSSGGGATDDIVVPPAKSDDSVESMVQSDSTLQPPPPMQLSVQPFGAPFSVRDLRIVTDERADTAVGATTTAALTKVEPQAVSATNRLDIVTDAMHVPALADREDEDGAAAEPTRMPVDAPVGTALDAIKVVTVSPKPSPTKPEPANATSTAHSVVSADAATLDTAMDRHSTELSEHEQMLAAVVVDDDNDSEEQGDAGTRIADAATVPLSLLLPTPGSASAASDDIAQVARPQAIAVSHCSLEFAPTIATHDAQSDSDDIDSIDVLELQDALHGVDAVVAADTRRLRAESPPSTRFTAHRRYDSDDADADADADVATLLQGRATATDFQSATSDWRGDAVDRPRELRSARSSVFSASIAASSSELSFQTSIPSLSSESGSALRTSRSAYETEGSREGSETRSRSVGSSIGSSMLLHQRSTAAAHDENDEDEIEIPDLVSDDEQRGYDEARAQTNAVERPAAQSSSSPSSSASAQHSPVAASRYDAHATTSVLSFSNDDDSEIEEMTLT